MPRKFVIDASVTIAWLFNEAGDAAKIENKLKDATLIVPWLWQLEVVNVILVRERRKLITVTQATQLLQLLEEWSLEEIHVPLYRNLNELASLARPHQLTAYDAVYLNAAIKLDLPLYTRDGNLRAAASRVGIPLI